ncbi:MAG: OmpA family protein [Hoeflea sp.]|nr:OmpA family protein [Hoeflea sp.]
MTSTRILLASTAISLCSIGFSHALPMNQNRSLNINVPVVTRNLINAQSSVADAEAALKGAVERQATAESTGGDVAQAQADVAAAEAKLEAAQAAAQATNEAEPEAPAPTAETAPVPEASSPAPKPADASTESDAAAVQPAAPVGDEAGTVAVEPVAENTTATEETPTETAPAATTPEVEDPDLPAPENTATPPATGPQAEEPAEAVEPDPAPANEPAVKEVAPVEDAPAEQTAPEAEDETATQPQAAAPMVEPAADTAPEDSQPMEAAPADATPADSEPEETPAQQGSADDNQAPAAGPVAEADAGSDTGSNTEAEADTASPDTPQEPEKAEAAGDEDVLTLPVEDGAPVLDSAKEDTGPEAGSVAAPAPASSGPAAPAPTSDADAQAKTTASEPAPQSLAEIGERMEERPEREAQTNVSVVNQIDNRTIIQIDNRTIIEHDDGNRLRAGSNEVYYEQLRGGRVREVIQRPNGVKLVTITNRWGDVIQRSKVMPDGREYVLFYAEAKSDGSREAFFDPGRELPPLRLSIPIGDYILDATSAEPSAFLNFLLEPPVEQVERLYSIEEVRRSARVRDKVRRVDLDSLTFEFGKATIAEDQIQRLADVADAISRILERNPAETFLIEGHTDAVGRDEANLLLSDRRAETIAVALSDVFGIPPENLVTQGYGERYLKVRTEAPERLNRRVTIRRITPLVTPVASR